MSAWIANAMEKMVLRWDNTNHILNRLVSVYERDVNLREKDHDAATSNPDIPT